jgi:hypothetical protein
VPGPEHRDGSDRGGRQEPRDEAARSGGARVGEIPAVEQERVEAAVERVEDHDETAVRRLVRAVEPGRDLDRVPRRAVQVSGLHVDLAARLGDVEMDHGRKLGAAAGVRLEGVAHGVDQRGHVQGGTHVRLADHQDVRHARSVPWAAVTDGQDHAARVAYASCSCSRRQT